MRKKAVLTLDSRYTTQIENAYYYCNPPETREIEKKIRSPIQEYLRRLLFKDLNKMTIEKVIEFIREKEFELNI
jgi:regulator of nonsense transcripts 2